MRSDFGKMKPLQAAAFSFAFALLLSLLALIVDWIPTLTFESLHHPERQGGADPSILWRPWVVGYFAFMLVLCGYLYWADRSRHPGAAWYRWAGRVAFTVALSGIFLFSAIRTWGVLLRAPWDRIVNGAILASYLLALALPIVRMGLARRLAEWQDSLGWIAVGFSSVAGTTGAWIGLKGGAERGWIGAFLCTIVAVLLAQHFSFQIWEDKRWEEQGKELRWLKRGLRG